MALPPCVVFEDDDLLVVNKPPGWNTHAPSPYAGEGVYDWLRHREPRWAELSILHRLDKETSGLMVFGKTPLANRSLTQQFEERRVEKVYRLRTDRPIQAADWIAQWSVVRAGDHYVARPQAVGLDSAETRFHRVAHGNGWTEWEAYPRTGRTHQIRVHLGHIGHHVLADKNYSGRDKITLGDIAGYEEPEADTVLIFRQALHAYRLRFTHPRRDEVISIEAPIPNDMLQTMAALRKYRPYRQGPFAPGLTLGNGR